MTALLSRTGRILSALVVLALVVAAVVVLSERDGTRTLTADFAATNSLYKGSDVKVLGVPVGRVTALEPRGEVVRATIEYSDDVELPADVKAVLVSPSVVGDRFVQLAPAYTKGPRLKASTHLPRERTAVPVELDEVYQSLDDLSVALGPKGANKDGSLSKLLDASARQLDGEGRQVNDTIRDVGRLSQTLENSSDDLFGSVREISEFVSMLRENDATVRRFNDSTAQVAEVLEGERGDLAATVDELSRALVDVRDLVKENRQVLGDDVEDLTSISRVLVKHRDALEQVVVDAPTALSNVALTYNGRYGTLDNRSNIEKMLFGGLEDPKTFLCTLLGESGTGSTDVCKTLGDLLGGLTGGSSSARNRAAVGAAPAAGSVATTRPDQVNDSIADMLGVAP
jgi:virulence factor Mce-like protein